ncbi:putative ABC transport system ATP-binding protein [Natranaerovirga hydrolytica]|uniref:Putative ABC transport system ATP-binding protein n=1 Tax=Natranaerovirga hydrolytica TaxID=680378 RepID=A0A4R1MY06_9FIRM|nr:ABC transporter ATP-binding protein [Natranaerovirga hydrolytica]TCK98157.1 putative ABC transport system ATP-binding protein [Natranaerovirga hydrolytica]
MKYTLKNANEDNDNIIEIRNVWKSYKEEVDKFILKDINLSIKKGEMLAIIGESGSGKTTLLNLLGCLSSITKGVYMLNTHNISLAKEKQLLEIRNRYIGFIMQEFGLLEELSVYENVKIPLLFNDQISFNEMNSKVDTALKNVSMVEKSSHKVKFLSGGQKQRVAIARALVIKPRIILADEPTGSLDKESSNDIISLFEKLNEKGITIVLVTHSLEIAKTCDRIIKLSDGKIVV